jgi:hypothetical protein
MLLLLLLLLLRRAIGCNACPLSLGRRLHTLLPLVPLCWLLD